MEMRKLLAIGFLLATGSQAFAADVPGRTYQKAEAIPFTWSGLYVGAAGGYGTSNTNGIDFKGVTAGGAVGFNAQWDMIVAGMEVSMNWSDIGQKESYLGLASAESRINAFGTVHGRLGVAIDQVLVYGLAGFAFATNTIHINVLGNREHSSANHVGYVVGGGAEFAMTRNWTIKGEYQYASYGSKTYFADIVPPGLESGKVDVSTFKVGINYLMH
jgi:outer membrane immunogenic protein